MTTGLHKGSHVSVESQPVEDRDISLPFGFAKRFGVLLSADEAQGLVLRHRPGLTARALAEVKRVVQAPFAVVALDETDFERELGAFYSQSATDARQMVEDLGDELDLARLADSLPEAEDLMEQAGDAPIIRLINAILTEAIKEKASDIHIETFEKRLSVRFRLDGVLREVVQPRRELAPLLVSRIKVMAKLDIAEKRIPQDGRISLRVGGREVDVRVSTLPSSSGERVVLRLLDKQTSKLSLDALGLAGSDLDRLQGVLQRPHGIILVTGPTGSGKTTTLYSALTFLNDSSRNILTVEDPIEYQLEGIGQTQVNVKADMTFARGLRAILRQDPDVVMVGEIRDRETAEIAVQASLTGHLVLSTLHTNTAIGAVTRLQDMGVEPFLLSSSLVALMAQRLVRTLCPACKRSDVPDDFEREFLRLAPGEKKIVYRPVGCPVCANTGYKGRTGLYELVVVDDAVRRLIYQGAGEEEITRAAREQGPGIRDDGRRRVLDGATTVQEVLRVTQED